MDKDERDLARIVELLGLNVQHVGELKRRVHWLSHEVPLIMNNPFVLGKYFVCQYTKIDPNNPEEVYTIALEEEGDGKFKRECNFA